LWELRRSNDEQTSVYIIVDRCDGQALEDAHVEVVRLDDILIDLPIDPEIDCKSANKKTRAHFFDKVHGFLVLDEYVIRNVDDASPDEVFLIFYIPS
jgi:hypothetical protein